MALKACPEREQSRSWYRGRLAPSPTGFLHLGHARTFWIAASRAREANGTLVLRNEDLDPDRSRTEYAEAMLADLRWLGVTWDEGPGLPLEGGGPCAPYAQSERRAHYLAAVTTLIERGQIYPCYCSRGELLARAPASVDGVVHAEDEEPIYPGNCRPGPHRSQQLTHLGAGVAGVNWRFRVPDGEEVCFVDKNFGPSRYVAGQDFGDFLVWRRDDVPAYQLAVTVDDAAMGITEVVRGADLRKSTARQLLLYRALRLQPPSWFHCPLVTDAEGRRLAKRAGSVSLRALRERGCSPEDALALAGIQLPK